MELPARDDVDDDEPDPARGALPTLRLDPVDRLLASAARCRDPRGEYTSLFFSEDVADTRRAQAICARCGVRELCLRKAIERSEPFGVWGGEFFLDGDILPVRRGRGRPPNVAVTTTVDEVTGIPVAV